MINPQCAYAARVKVFGVHVSDVHFLRHGNLTH